MDIDDILASVSGPRTDPRTTDLQLLTRAWVAERTAPELLPYPSELLERVMGRVGKQIERVEDMASNQSAASNFSLIVVQTELERFKFLVRSFLRARIAKIDKFPHHYLALSQSSSQSQSQQTDPFSSDPYSTNHTQTLLSPTESQYLAHHSTLLSHHYNSSFLSSFPTALQRLDDTGGGISMIDAPDADTAVFCRVLRDVGIIEVQAERDVHEVNLRRGDVWVMRWRAIRDEVRRGDVELI